MQAHVTVLPVLRLRLGRLELFGGRRLFHNRLGLGYEVIIIVLLGRSVLRFFLFGGLVFAVDGFLGLGSRFFVLRGSHR